MPYDFQIAVDAIYGIPPTVAIEQRMSRGGQKSTVATLTEIHHFLRLLFVKLGTQYCPACDVPIEPQTEDSIVANVMRDYRGERVIEHGGAIFGVYTYIAMFPDRNFGVALQMNSEDVQVMRGLALELIDQYLGAPHTDWISAFKMFLDQRMQGGIAALDASAKSVPVAKGTPSLPLASWRAASIAA